MESSGKFGWCGDLSPHDSHVYKTSARFGRIPAMYATCMGVYEMPKFRHKHTLVIVPRTKQSKVLKFRCEECNLIFHYKGVSVRRIVSGKSKNYNPQMLVEVYDQDKRNKENNVY